MRIIAGRFGGRKLVSFKEDHIRPTTDRVKESIFNRWMSYLEGSRCLDLFSGTGNLAIEALSRGAEKVVAIEKSRRSIQVIEKNKKEFGLSNDELEILCSDVFKYLEKYEGPAFDLVFVDPPFTESLGEKLLTALSQSAVMGEGSKMVMEIGTKEIVTESHPPLQFLERRPFGDKSVLYYAYESR